MLWKLNHDDRKDGTGPMAGRPLVQTAGRRRRPQRQIRHPLHRLAALLPGQRLRLTGDPSAADCRNVARGFRNTARWSPNGFMCLTVEPKGGTRNLYAFQGPFEKYRASRPAVLRPLPDGPDGPRPVGVLPDQPDIEALDPIIGFADLMTHHAMLKDPQGKRAGWTYAWATTGARTPWEAGGQERRWHYNCCRGHGWPRCSPAGQDYIEVCKDAVAQYGPGFDISAGVMGAQFKAEPRPRRSPTSRRGDGPAAR